MSVNKKLKKYINDRGVKQTAIANAIGMKCVTLNAILNGRTAIKVSTLIAISKFLNIDPKEFLVEE